MADDVNVLFQRKGDMWRDLEDGTSCGLVEAPMVRGSIAADANGHGEGV
jgi:hypothetical protein